MPDSSPKEAAPDVVPHIGLALRLARRRWWMHRVMPREDYEGEALLALVLAATKFRTGRAKFTTFAYPCITGALINAERAWMGYNRRDKTGPSFESIDDETDVVFRGMAEADLDPIAIKYENEWFARPARMYLLAGLSATEVARICNCTLNTVHQSVSYFRKRLTRELAA